MANLLDLLKFIDQMKQHEASLAAAPAQTADGKPATPVGQTADTTSPVAPPGVHPVVAKFLQNMSKGQSTGDALKSAVMKGA